MSEDSPPTHLTVVIPCYNEEARLGASLDALLAFLSERGDPFEIVIVDDGSTDRTADCARTRSDPRLRIIVLPRNRGKGAAVKAGVMAAQGDRILMMDADLSTPLEELEKLSRALDAGADVAIGSRALERSLVTRPQGLFRDRIGRAFNGVVRTLLVPGIRDSQCGFKLFLAPVAKSIFRNVRCRGWAFDVEVLLVAKRMGFVVREIPVHWENDTASHVRVVRDAPATLASLLAMRLRWWARRPKDR